MEKVISGYGDGASAIRFWPLALYFFLVVATAAGMIVISYMLGQRHRERATGQPYESGIVSTGTARLRFGVR
ncbi:MAG: hypothetical protein M0Z58_00590, partial [Nitrospiraceae bacterium]|nr:hypothetical protein [Nitrospiraceae bacterium]